tara:strand:+ start:1186 stop:1842 length:657 start_codon:yes stop_codon:yes gene_type:complete
VNKSIIAYYRAKHNLSQTQMGRKLSITQAEVSRLENENIDRKIRIETLNKISTAFNLNINDVLNKQQELQGELELNKFNANDNNKNQTGVYGHRNMNGSINMTNTKPNYFVPWKIKDNQFLVQITANCMQPIIKQGAYVLCDYDANYSVGDQVFVQINNPNAENELMATARTIDEYDSENIKLSCFGKAIIFKDITNKKVTYDKFHKITKIVAVFSQI